MYIFIDENKFNGLDKESQEEILRGDCQSGGHLKESVVTLSMGAFINTDIGRILNVVGGYRYRVLEQLETSLIQQGTDSNYTIPTHTVMLKRV